MNLKDIYIFAFIERSLSGPRRARSWGPKVVFMLSYNLVFPICQIIGTPTPDTSEEEVCLLNLIHLDEMRREAKLANEAHKRHIKVQYDKMVQPLILSEGDLVLLYDQ